MNRRRGSHFEVIKKEFKSAFRKIANELDDDRISEAAFPAYAHDNPIIDLIFWNRLKTA